MFCKPNCKPKRRPKHNFLLKQTFLSINKKASDPLGILAMLESIDSNNNPFKGYLSRFKGFLISEW
jgi:hypothetical protein